MQTSNQQNETNEITMNNEITAKVTKVKSHKRTVKAKAAPVEVAAALQELAAPATIKKANGWAYAAGIVIGGIIPAIAHDVAHNQTDALPMLWAAVAAFLAYSAPLGAEYMTRYIGQIKAWGLIIGLEAAMTLTHGWTDWAALAVLTGINAYVLAGRFTQD